MLFIFLYTDFIKLMEKAFTNIYINKIWGNNGVRQYDGSSGHGSVISFNKDTYVPFLKKFITDNNIKNVTDLGCGDFKCGKIIYHDLNVIYTGYDVYEKIVVFNSNFFSLPKYSFRYLDFCNNKESIATGELCILKDVLQHWSLDNIYSFLDYLVEHKIFKYILICNCCFQTDDADADDTKDGDFRPLSCDYLPLKKYNPVKLYNYHSKEVSVIEINQGV
jgi:hypothetical protein